MGYLFEVIAKKKPRLPKAAGIVLVYERHQTQRIESNSTCNVATCCLSTPYS